MCYLFGLPFWWSVREVPGPPDNSQLSRTLGPSAVAAGRTVPWSNPAVEKDEGRRPGPFEKTWKFCGKRTVGT